ncbi:MAG: response regulator, partial [Pseudomonadota bacterium]|nr:response regulator [Pseudomonadota bacterium]
GSTFTLYLPVTYTQRPRKQLGSIEAFPKRLEQPGLPTNLLPGPADMKLLPIEPAIDTDHGHLINEIGDDRDAIQPADRVVLIVENDSGFARFLLETAREKGCKALVTSLGAAALALTADYKPDAILLDIHLPDMQGWRVLERLKHDVTTRHIPICVISTDESRERALTSGALTFVTKPIQKRDVLDALMDALADYNSRDKRTVLVVDGVAKRRVEVVEALKIDNLEVVTANTEALALKKLRRQTFDCVILNSDALDIIPELKRPTGETEGLYSPLAVIIYGHDEIDETALRRRNENCLVRVVRSPDRLLDVLMFCLHRKVESLPEGQRKKLIDLYQSDKLLAGKKVLIVDDDARNIFALTSVLEEYQMTIQSADSGREAINILEKDPDFDIVLMDIMMPEMDGMETIQEIRKISHLKNLPIIAVTAKAMKGDREKCLEAGAWDYLSKPVDTEQMMTALRAWLHR